ncbi:MAG: hypothetical protein NC397_08225 [Clostridium sp.]|nr:hypothetical protein [Clostridium sp.]
MYLGGIWIKAIVFVILSILTIICGLYAYKKFDWKQYEFSFVLVCSAILFVLGCINISYAAKPSVKKVNVNYNYQSSDGVIFGREYHFFDSNGNAYDFTMDPITASKIFKGKDFNEETKYTIVYEEKSNVIVGIEEQ